MLDIGKQAKLIRGQATCRDMPILPTREWWQKRFYFTPAGLFDGPCDVLNSRR